MQDYHFQGSDARNLCATTTPGGVDMVSGSAGSMDALPGVSSSMALSVTRHAQNPPVEKFTFLLCGVDTLDLGLYVTWETNWKKILQTLDAKKEQALGTRGLLDTTDIGREFLHLPSGKPPNYRYHLQFPEYHIYLAISEKFGTSPNVYLSISSETIWHVGLVTILNLIECDLSHFGGTVHRIQPSRCDLCIDFRIDGPLTLPFLDAHRISRSRKTRAILDGDTLETYYCGSPASPHL